MAAVETFAVIGAGNGGKAAAADLALQGKRVRLCEFPEFAANVSGLGEPPVLHASGAIEGEALLELATTDLARAVEGADAVMACTQALAHERVARELAPLVRPGQLVVLNPGSTGGALQLAHLWRSGGMRELPVIAEFHTLTYGCRAKGADVKVSLKVGRPVLYSTLPAGRLDEFAGALEAVFPSLERAADVLEVGLNNANPVIHPAITILNASRIENEGGGMLFYADGMSEAAARLIRAVDAERMAILQALGYPATPEPERSVAQGYAASTDYLECYRDGPAFATFAAPDTLDHRYLHEDCGMGLVSFISFGRLAGVPTPACEAVVAMASVLAGVDYLGEGRRTLDALGLGGLGAQSIKDYLRTGTI